MKSCLVIVGIKIHKTLKTGLLEKGEDLFVCCEEGLGNSGKKKKKKNQNEKKRKEKK